MRNEAIFMKPSVFHSYLLSNLFIVIPRRNSCIRNRSSSGRLRVGHGWSGHDGDDGSLFVTFAEVLWLSAKMITVECVLNVACCKDFCLATNKESISNELD